MSPEPARSRPPLAPAARLLWVPALALALAGPGTGAQDACLGPLPPATAPTVFAPGVVSTPAEEYGVSFTPDGGSVYFSRSEVFFPASRKATIMVSHRRENRWSAPEVVSFSGQHGDIDPFVSPDGSRLYFSSTRPVSGSTRGDLNVWVVERTAGGWGEPALLGGVNSEHDELYPSVSADGTVYFASDRPGGLGGFDIYKASRDAAGRYGPAENLGAGVNTPLWEFNPAVSPDGRTLVFTGLDHPGGLGLGDLYVSCQTASGWTKGRNLGPAVNSAKDEYHPSISPDRRSLFFLRRDGHGDVHQVPWPLP